MTMLGVEDITAVKARIAARRAERQAEAAAIATPKTGDQPTDDESGTAGQATTRIPAQPGQASNPPGKVSAWRLEGAPCSSP